MRSKLPGCTSVELLVAGKGCARCAPGPETVFAGCGDVAKAGAAVEGVSKVLMNR